MYRLPARAHARARTQARSHPGSEGMAFLQELPEGLHLQLSQLLYKRSLEKVGAGLTCLRGRLRDLGSRVAGQGQGPLGSRLLCCKEVQRT